MFCILALFFRYYIYIMELSKPYKGKGKRKIKENAFHSQRAIFLLCFFWVVIISIYLAYY